MDKTIETEGRKYLKFRMTADLLCIGERMRGQAYRRCLEVIPCTTLEGAFKARFPHPNRVVYAAAKFTRKPKKEVLVYSPRDRVADNSKVPLHIEYLTDVVAEAYVLKNDWTRQMPEIFEMQIGAMRPQGFGVCRFEFQGEVNGSNPRQGELALRVLNNDKVKEAFGIRRVINERYGYLFVPEHGNKGHYELALFEGSIVVADPIILKDTPLAESKDRDRIKPIIDALRHNPDLIGKYEQAATGKLRREMTTACHNAASVFEQYGYDVTDLYLKDKKTQKGANVKKSAELIGIALSEIKRNDDGIIENNRAIGMTILKSLPVLLRASTPEAEEEDE